MQPPDESSLLAAHRDGRLGRAHIERFADELAAAQSQPPPPRPAGCDCQRSDGVRRIERLRRRLDDPDARRTLSRWARHFRSAGAGDPPDKPTGLVGVGLHRHLSAVLRRTFLYEGRMSLPAADAPPTAADALDDLAAVVVELEVLRHPELAHWFIATWAEQTGAYGELGRLRSRIALATTDWLAGKPDCAGAELHRILGIGESWLRPTPGALVITHGLSGAGKTTLAQALIGPLGAITLRIDAEISRTGPPSPLTALVDQLVSTADGLVRSGWPTIVEACFLDRGNRARFRDLARRLGVPFLILECAPPLEVVERRLDRRRAYGSLFHGEEISLETVGSRLREQLRRCDPLDGEERRGTLTVDTSRPTDTAGLIREIRRRLAGADQVPGPAVR